MSRLSRNFFARDTCLTARDLLGRVLVHEVNGQRLAGRIVETEAYTGWEDQASHGHRGQTPRNVAMFGPVGVSYVYLIYGMYWLFNIVARPPGVDYPAAILIRALEPLEGLEQMAQHRPGRPQTEWAAGPGRLTLALGIDGSHDRQDLAAAGGALYLETGSPLADAQVQTGPRVGMGNQVGEPWFSIDRRYWVAGNPYVSKKR